MASKVLKRSKAGEIYHPGSNIVFTSDKVAYGVLVNGKVELLSAEQVALCNELGFKYDPKKVVGYQSETSGEEEESSDDGEDGSGEEETEEVVTQPVALAPQPVPVVSEPIVAPQPVPVVAPAPVIDQTARSCTISPRELSSEGNNIDLPCENTFLAMMKKMHLDATVTLPERERELASIQQQLATTKEQLASTQQQLASVQAKFDIIRSAFN